MRIAEGASIWYGVVLRGDMEPITIGPDINIQDNCTAHTDHGHPTVIGAGVSVGHNAVIHGCSIEDDCLIGIGALVLSRAVIHKGSVVAAGAVVQRVSAEPLLAVFYALGFAPGNMVGIAVERKIALGFMILRVFTRSAGRSMAERLRELGQPVTVFRGEGMRGPVDELYIACRRRDLKRILAVVNEEDPQSFYITEMARDVRKAVRPLAVEFTGWRAVFTRK